MLMKVENDVAYPLFHVMSRLSSGRPRKKIDVISFHNRSFGDDTYLLEIAAEQFHSGNVQFIEITNNEGERYGSTIKYEANPGRSYYERRLRALGIPKKRIAIPRTKAFHTRQENTAFIRQARYQGWTKGALLAHSYQLPRAMLGAVQAMEEVGYQVELYTFAPIDPDETYWQEPVKGSQGAEEKPRWAHIQDEFDRILHYQQTGELASFEQLIQYLDARDTKRLALGDLDRGSQRINRYLPPELQRPNLSL